MPIYEYICNDCGSEIEVLQKISDPAPVTCTSCGADSLKKKVSAAAFRLKGGGWYETDFKSGEKRNIAGDGEGSSAAKSAKDKSGGTTKERSGSADAGASSRQKKTETASSGGSTTKSSGPSTKAKSDS